MANQIANYLENERASLCGQLAYVECALLTNLEPWERKEFEVSKKDLNLRIAGINCAIEYRDAN
jgi:hypothetical protein